MSKKKKKAMRYLITVLMMLVSVSMLIPFFWMLSSSFKRPVDIFTYPIKWMPNYLYLDNYKYLFEHEDIFRTYFNSIKVSCINVAGACLTSALAAYAFAKMKFRGRDLLFLIYISTLMVPVQATYVPKFVLFTQLGLRNTHLALILPGLYAVLGTFLLRQFFMQIPDAIIESASMDGARQLTIWWRIMMPMVKPALATFAIIVFAFHWNDYENPLIFISNKKLFTIPLALSNFTDENGRMYHYIMALTSIAIVPIFIVFLVGQRFFIEGMTAGAVKG